MTHPYALDDVLRREEVSLLSPDDRLRVVWTYQDTYAAYEANVPYSHDRLPGIAGVHIYQLNKSICAYGAALRTAHKLMNSYANGEKK